MATTCYSFSRLDFTLTNKTNLYTIPIQWPLRTIILVESVTLITSKILVDD
jgi:hypothetical protein